MPHAWLRGEIDDAQRRGLDCLNEAEFVFTAQSEWRNGLK